MKIAIAQLNYTQGDISGNRDKIILALNEARKKGAELALFSELAMTGYPPLDLLLDPDFINASMNAIIETASHCHGIAALVGSPSPNTGVYGKSLHNSAFFLHEGRVRAVINKTLLPSYDIYDEDRYFQPGIMPQTIELKGVKIAVTICEDIWEQQPYGDREMWRLYSSSPLGELSKEKPAFIVNIAASPFAHTRMKIREGVFIRTAREQGAPLISVSQCGGYSELIYDGSSVVVDSDGEILERLPFCSEEIRIIELPLTGTDKSRFTRPPSFPEDMTSHIHKALVTGIKDFFSKGGMKKALIGLSGGIDSAVVTALATEALGAENILVLLLPSKYSSEQSVTDSVRMAEELGTDYQIVSIRELYEVMEKGVKPHFEGESPDVTEENIQARLRAVILMAFANKFGYMLLNTSNKSETAVGYTTLYGDMAGGLSVIGDLYKTEVYRLAAEINSQKEIIPRPIIERPPSAELRPDQLDTDSLPPYDLLDPVLFRHIERGWGTDRLIDEGFDPDLVKRVIRLVRNSEFKRKQAPPILRISAKAFGSGRRIPLVGNLR